MTRLSALPVRPLTGFNPSLCPGNTRKRAEYETEELPALKDTSTTATIGGLQNIIEYLRSQNPSWDLDRDDDDDPITGADQIAFTSHILARGNALLALSLFVSTDNYTTTTRPTYSSILPWPTQYIIPPSLRSKARQLTAHLGLSTPDLDDNDEEEEEVEEEDEESTMEKSTRAKRKRDSGHESEEDQEKAEKNRLKYSYVACEVLSSETWSILEALMQNEESLRDFWSFMKRPAPLDPLQAGYFTKVNETLLEKKTEEMLEFLKSIDGIIPAILQHVDCPMVMDLLLKIISLEKADGGQGTVDVW